MDIFTGIVKLYYVEDTLMSDFNRGWHSFAMENEECIAIITMREDMDLP